MEMRAYMTQSERDRAAQLARIVPREIRNMLGDVEREFQMDYGHQIENYVPLVADGTHAFSTSRPVEEPITANQTGASSSSAQASTGPSRLGTAIAVQNPIPDGYNSRLTQSSGIIPRPRRVVSDEEIEQVNQDYVPLERQPLPDVYSL